MYGFCLCDSDARIADAIDWFRKAATQGSIDAYRMLGVIYDPGSCLAGREDEQSLKDATQAAEFSQLGLQVARPWLNRAMRTHTGIVSVEPQSIEFARHSELFQKAYGGLELLARVGEPVAAYGTLL